MGDFNGIGPEVTLKSILHPRVRRACIPLLVGSIDVYSYYAKRLRVQVTLKEVEGFDSNVHGNAVPVYEIHKFRVPKVHPGSLSAEAGKYAGEAITAAAGFCAEGIADGMVTAPIAKETMYAAGYKFPGHTEMLAHLTRTKQFMMMLVAARLRVGLVTIHAPLKRVPGLVSRERIRQIAHLMNRSLREDFGIRRPRIAVLGMNPHAGEGGMLGDEELSMITPAIRALRRSRVLLDGPFPADGFFGARSDKRYDGVIAMYHDQGLVPLKLLGFAQGVNYTAGLPIVRTSPDHGTAFAIAGRGIADPSSMIEAILLAARIINNRRHR